MHIHFCLAVSNMSNDLCPFSSPTMSIASCASVCTHTKCFDSPGSFSSPGYPNEDWNFVSMSWLITAPAGQNVTIYFVDFCIENTASCDFDYVILYDGDSASDPRIGDNKYCSINSPWCQETSSNNLLVTFTSDGTNQYKGFSATFYFGGQYE